MAALYSKNGAIVRQVASFTRSGGKDAVPLGRHMRAGRNKN